MLSGRCRFARYSEEARTSPSNRHIQFEPAPCPIDGVHLKLEDCPTGEAKLTSGFRLPARYVIHTVGPRWKGGKKGEAKLLASCYQKSLRIAADNKMATVAFPAISCGIYGYPLEEAVAIALRETRAFLAKYDHPQKVNFCCFDEKTAEAYRNV